MSVFISPGLLLSPAIYGEPLHHARIGYKSIVTRDNVTGTAAQSGFSISAIANPATYERYKPAVIPANIVIDAGAEIACGYIGIAAHSIGSSRCSVSIQYSLNNSDWSTIDTVTPVDNQTIMAIFEPVASRYWRLVVSASAGSPGSSPPTVGVVYIGTVLQMQRAIHGGHSPLTLSRITAVRPSVSETGQWLGSTQERKGFKTSYAWSNLKSQWYRLYFDPFVATNPRAKPFFIALNPLQYPDDVGYCWSTDDIQPSNSGGKDYMSVSMSVEGFNDRD